MDPIIDYKSTLILVVQPLTLKNTILFLTMKNINNNSFQNVTGVIRLKTNMCTRMPSAADFMRDQRIPFLSFFDSFVV